MSSLLLAGDIGGTHTRLRLESEEAQIFHQREDFNNSDYNDLTSIIKEFLEEAAKNAELEGNSTPQIACFAVAGPVDEKQNICPLTNINWTLDGKELQKELDIETVKLINDFKAVGYGILPLPKSECNIKILQQPKQESEEEEKPFSPMGVIGAGTGLGEAFILKKTRDDNIGKVYPTEGGHVDFPASSLEEFQLMEYIKDKYKLEHVSVERVVSGPGIVAIYQFLRNIKQYNELEEIKNELTKWENSGSELCKAPSQKIAEAALKKEDELCKETIRMFVKAYGSEVGNFALKLLPYGGLYIAGGIAPKIFQDQELEKLFLKELKNKGRMNEVIENIPIYLVKNEQVGLIGAAYYAKTEIRKNSTVETPKQHNSATI